MGFKAIYLILSTFSISFSSLLQNIYFFTIVFFWSPFKNIRKRKISFYTWTYVQKKPKPKPGQALLSFKLFSLYTFFSLYLFCFILDGNMRWYYDHDHVCYFSFHRKRLSFLDSSLEVEVLRFFIPWCNILEIVLQKKLL